jgi:hypothetical protein
MSPPATTPVNPARPRRASLLTGPAKNPLYKTQLCANFSAMNTCPYSTRCQFAHGQDELERWKSWRLENAKSDTPIRSPAEEQPEEDCPDSPRAGGPASAAPEPVVVDFSLFQRDASKGGRRASAPPAAFASLPAHPAPPQAAPARERAATYDNISQLSVSPTLHLPDLLREITGQSLDTSI